MPFSAHNRERPKSTLDFDLNYGIHELVRTVDRPELVVFVRSVWINVVFGIVGPVVLAGVVVAVMNLDAFFFDFALWKQLLVGGFGLLMVAIGVWMSIVALVTRGRLEIDAAAQELRFFYTVFDRPPRHVLRFDAIAQVGRRELGTIGDSDGPGWTYQFVVAELTDGRFVSIAVDPRFGDVRRSLEKAMERAKDTQPARALAEPVSIG